MPTVTRVYDDVELIVDMHTRVEQGLKILSQWVVRYPNDSHERSLPRFSGHLE